MDGVQYPCRAQSATAAAMPSTGAESGSPTQQGWQLSGRTSNMSLVLWYPSEAPGCSIKVCACCGLSLQHKRLSFLECTPK